MGMVHLNFPASLHPRCFEGMMTTCGPRRGSLRALTFNGVMKQALLLASMNLLFAYKME
jgi:hypothetical protein